jgi:hypothetical protein
LHGKVRSALRREGKLVRTLRTVCNGCGNGARLGFELKAKGAPGDKAFDIGTPLQILAISAEGKEYETLSAMAPEPGLSGTLRSGDAMEGWVVFSVPEEDSRPLMIFDPSSGAGMHRGNILFFKLY